MHINHNIKWHPSRTEPWSVRHSTISGSSIKLLSETEYMSYVTVTPGVLGFGSTTSLIALAPKEFSETDGQVEGRGHAASGGRATKTAGGSCRTGTAGAMIGRLPDTSSNEVQVLLLPVGCTREHVRGLFVTIPESPHW